MKIRVLGCSGSIAAGSRTTAFLLDDDVLIDAGTGVGDLSVEAMQRIDHILLTHSHLDHVLGVPLMADTVLRHRRDHGRGPIIVRGLPETLSALRDHLFNGALWPDFTRLPNPHQPVLRLLPLAVGEVVELAAPGAQGPARRIEVLSAEHAVPAVGYAVLAPAGAWVFTGDTGPNPRLWERLKHLPTRVLVIETAFGDDEQALAQISGHHSPGSLARELPHAPAGAAIHLTHAKPGELDTVMAEVAAHGWHVQALEAGQVFHLG